MLVDYLGRIKEHATSEKCEGYKHLLQNPTHCVGFNTPTILGMVVKIKQIGC